MWPETILIALIPAIASGLISYFVAVKKSKADMRLLIKQGEVDFASCRRKAAQKYCTEKEFDYFEKTDVICADLIVAVQDTCDALTGEVCADIEQNQKMAKENFLVLLEHYLALKSLSLMSRPYLPEYVNISTKNTIHIFNENMQDIGNHVEDLFKSEIIERESTGWNRIKEFETIFLESIANIESAKKQRLAELLA